MALAAALPASRPVLRSSAALPACGGRGRGRPRPREGDPPPSLLPAHTLGRRWGTGLGQALGVCGLTGARVSHHSQKPLICSFPPSWTGPCGASRGGREHETPFGVTPPPARPRPDSERVSGHAQPWNKSSAPGECLIGPSVRCFRESSRGDEWGFPRHTAAEQENVFSHRLGCGATAACWAQKHREKCCSGVISRQCLLSTASRGFFWGGKSAQSGNNRTTAQDFPRL